MNGTFTCVYFLMQEDKTGVLYVTEKGIKLENCTYNGQILIHVLTNYLQMNLLLGWWRRIRSRGNQPAQWYLWKENTKSPEKAVWELWGTRSFCLQGCCCHSLQMSQWCSQVCNKLLKYDVLGYLYQVFCFFRKWVLLLVNNFFSCTFHTLSISNPQ